MVIKDKWGVKHEVFLVDMGTMDTWLKIDGVKRAFDCETAADYRMQDGSWSDRGFRAFAKWAVNDCLE